MAVNFQGTRIIYKVINVIEITRNILIYAIFLKSGLPYTDFISVIFCHKAKLFFSLNV